MTDPSKDQTQQNEPLPVESLAYAPYAGSNAPRVWAAFAILQGGLALIVLGGCFLIGVMLSLTNGLSFSAVRPPLTSPMILLITVLYILAGGAIGGGILVISIGIRGLWRVVKT